MYSNGLSEIILGKAIKELKLPRDEIVVMTKVCYRIKSFVSANAFSCSGIQLNGTVARDYKTRFIGPGANPDNAGYVNQHGLSRKVCLFPLLYQPTIISPI